MRYLIAVAGASLLAAAPAPDATAQTRTIAGRAIELFCGPDQLGCGPAVPSLSQALNDLGKSAQQYGESSVKCSQSQGQQSRQARTEAMSNEGKMYGDAAKAAKAAEAGLDLYPGKVDALAVESTRATPWGPALLIKANPTPNPAQRLFAVPRLGIGVLVDDPAVLDDIVVLAPARKA